MDTSFLPILNGFKFQNRFEKNWPNRFIKILLGNSAYGLCGGMVFSALDYFLEGKSIITTSKIVDLEPDYIRHLWKRQFASMPVRNYFLLASGTFQKDSTLLTNTFNKEIPKVIESINQNLPAPIIIIRSKKLENPMDNHQILLTGYDIKGPITNFTSYDPNHPLKTTYLTVNRKSREENITQSTGEFVRGFFLNCYDNKKQFSRN
ncbi:MAG: hypothetical protein CVU46_05405 [Chloroflexi bacterium HGW-Chloroflexi-8]|nr:MAG: hypothetical protein CVU46_05405 [Chloroflexi bacterium HGW-Chloroflexi-8]